MDFSAETGYFAWDVNMPPIPPPASPEPSPEPPSRDAVSDVLRARFHLDSFRKGQRPVIESVLAGRDTIAVMPTGGGKSLCYQLPAVLSDGLAVVIAPLISLMQDQVRNLRALGIRAGCLHSGQSRDEKLEIFSEMKKGGAYLLYLSPERVQSPGFGPWLRERNVSLVAIDEAHCVSQWGPEFRQDYHRLHALRDFKPGVPILALTATATPDVLRDIARQLKLASPERHVYGFYRPNLFYQVEAVASEHEKSEYMKEAIRRSPGGRVLVYCGTRRQCEETARELAGHFDGVGFYHAGMPAEDRNRAQRDYEAGRTRILAATNAFGMGMDYPDVRLVVHLQVPASVEAYYQEVGRAGRDGRKSHCLLLYAKKDKNLHTFFIRESKAEANVIRQRWRSLDAIVGFVEGGECRHAGILTYFRDSERIGRCGHCDVCAPSDEMRVPRPRPEPSAPPRVRVRKGSKREGARDDAPLGPEEEARAIALQDWRRKYAAERDMAAFIVFSNKTLRDLARRNPRTLGELESVHGFGPGRISQLGGDVLAELRKLD